MNIRTEVNGRPVIRVSELAEKMGVCPHTIFNYIRHGQLESVLLNSRDRRIFLDSVIGRENIHRPFADIGKVARILKLSRSRICHFTRQNALEYVVGPGRVTLVFTDTLTTPDYCGKELVTIKEAFMLTGISEDKLRSLMDNHELQFVRIPSGMRRIILEDLARFFTINEEAVQTVKKIESQATA